MMALLFLYPSGSTSLVLINVAEYEVLVIGLVSTLQMGIRRL